MTLCIDSSRFENVFIYVADAFRYDYVPESLSTYGSKTKTIPGGVATPTSFSTLLTGQYAPVHGVYRFAHRLDNDLLTLYDFFPQASFVTGKKYSAPLRETLNLAQFPEEGVSSLETPFACIVRDLSTHHPYPITNEGRDWESTTEYWANRKRDMDSVFNDYKQGIQNTIDRFERHLDTLADRGILDETLVIFTADHGEALGEFGFVTHGPPTSPLQVHVPTVFCNEGVSFEGSVLAHIDYLPTIASIIGAEIDTNSLPGYDLTESAPDDRMILNQAWLPYITETSVWDGDGGYVFSEASTVDRLRWFKRLVWGGSTAPYHRRGLLSTLQAVFMSDREYGSPNFSRRDADEFRERVTSNTTQATKQEVSEAARQRLQDLGYKDEI
jgi:hypothetical protein